MPCWRELPPCASSGWRRKATAALVLLVAYQLLTGSTLLDPHRISSPGSLIWRSFSPAFEVAEVVKKKRWRDGNPDWAGAHPRWWLLRGYGTCCCGRLPAVSNLPSNLLAEWRPFLFLPAKMPDGRQCIFSMESMARCHGGSAVPSGAVPGDDEARFMRRMIGTRSRFPFTCWGPLCKSQGPVCYFLFGMGPVVRSSVLQLCL
ncbi:unnamed protein product [Alopecurus aequalis]